MTALLDYDLKNLEDLNDEQFLVPGYEDLKSKPYFEETKKPKDK